MKLAAVRWLLVMGSVLISATTVAYATPIIYVNDTRGQLATVDVPTGASTVVGSFGELLTDIAFTSSGAMFAIDFNNLYSMNQTTGATTLIGGLGAGAGGMNALVGFGTGLIGASFLDANLYSINPTTGASTALIGANPFPSAGDLAFNGGFLYEAAVNGTGTDLLRISIVGNTFTSVDLGQIVNNTGLFGLVNASDGQLYGVDGRTVYLINTTTPGASSIVSTYGAPAFGANGAASPTEAATVPEPATLTLLGSGLLIALRWRKGSRRG